MKCVICKHGETKPGKVSVTLERGEATIVFKDVPAKVCDNCGEKYIDEDVARELLAKAQELIENGTQVDIRKFQSAA
ncbi:type II toxin-antitoxin system MqsA family antitoxin [Hydrogenimonas sp.]